MTVIYDWRENEKPNMSAAKKTKTDIDNNLLPIAVPFTSGNGILNGQELNLNEQKVPADGVSNASSHRETK